MSELLLPAWIDTEAWVEFLKARKLLKKPMTEYAQKLAIKRLESFRAAGHDANASIQQSILNGWQGLFEPRAEVITQATKTDYVKTQQRLAAEDAREGVDAESLRRNAAQVREKALGIRRGNLPH